ncbi:MAG: hypothetical protein LBL34_04080 [Clostridiales bacterium]|nr:hypothetical protein [Clostridiales bacterium]
MRCKNFITTEISAFDMRDGVEIECECGGNDMTISQENRQYVFAYMCPSCRKPYIKRVDIRTFWENEQLIFTCTGCGAAACSIGNSHNKQIKFLSEKSGEFYENDMILSETEKVLSRLVSQKKVTCECGGRAIDVSAGLRGVDLSCRKCGACKFVRAITEDDLLKNRSIKRILLAKKSNKVIKLDY